MLIKSRAIVLHTIKYTDDSVIAELLTEAQGCVSFLVKLSRSRKAAVKAVFLQPLTLLEVEWNKGERQSLSRMKNVRVFQPFASLPYDPHKSAVAMFLAEFLHHALREEPPSQPLFEYVMRSVEWLDACEKGFANFHIVFLLRLTRFLGFLPDLDEWREGYYFDLSACTFTADAPLHGHFLVPEDAAHLPRLMRMRFGTMHVFRFSGRERNRLLVHINDFYRLHLPQFPELKSLAVLRELFG